MTDPNVVDVGLEKMSANMTNDLTAKVIAELGGNIISVVHDRMDSHNSINGCVIRIELETRNADHIREIKDGLNEEGYQVM